ncbi:MAG: hypothetical protein ABS79_01005 [Planctomycetes bacterium SCN 63-9]|nr:MAG: hypothetical protein ABS79_01005 [Planctomycetes bacterium SCN 63-9]
MSKSYTILCHAEALSPITHMSGSSGNESIVAREAVVTPRGVAMIPCLSGNAIRHRCVRDPGMQWLVDAYGLKGKLTLKHLNFLFHGGNLTDGGGREDTRRIADFQRLWPLGRLLGGCLPDQILAGSLQVWRGTMACEENHPYLASVLPGETLGSRRLRASETFITGYQYIRADAVKTKTDLASGKEPCRVEGTTTAGYNAFMEGLAPLIGDIDAATLPQSAPGKKSEEWWVETPYVPWPQLDAIIPKGVAKVSDRKSNLMIFAGQAITRGAAFLLGFTVPHSSELELGALLWSLQLWQAAGGTVGGQAARGHGRLGLSILDFGEDVPGLIDAYKDYAMSVKDEAVAWLEAAFATKAKEPKPAKPKKGEAA